MESWRLVWREGFAPCISVAGLQALWSAVATDDPRLVQGASTTPPPLMCVQDWPVSAADCPSICGWLGEGLTTVGEVEEYRARLCFEADQRLGEPAACRWFLHWFDDTPRGEMRRELQAEVERAMSERGGSGPKWKFFPTKPGRPAVMVSEAATTPVSAAVQVDRPGKTAAVWQCSDPDALALVRAVLAGEWAGPLADYVEEQGGSHAELIAAALRKL